jgi:hypothetical protein
VKNKCAGAKSSKGERHTIAKYGYWSTRSLKRAISCSKFSAQTSLMIALSLGLGMARVDLTVRQSLELVGDQYKDRQRDDAKRDTGGTVNEVRDKQ